MAPADEHRPDFIDFIDVASCTGCPMAHEAGEELACHHPHRRGILVGGLDHAIHQDCPLRCAHLTIRGAIGA